MYIWRRWRDTAGYFFLALIFSIILAITAPSTRSRGHALLAIESSWLLLGIPAGLFIGLFIGSRSIGTEIAGWDGDFIMTRPRSRKYFIWTGWAVGVAEILLILVITALCKVGALCYEDGFFWRQLPATTVDIPVLLASVAVFTLVVYSATYLVSVWTRRSGVAKALALGSGLAYEAIVNVVGWANSHLPDLLVVPYKGLHADYVRATAIHALITWTICAFLFPLLAQLVFEGSEICRPQGEDSAASIFGVRAL